MEEIDRALSPDRLPGITKRILQLCDDALSKEKVYLLSRLGIDLGQDVQAIRQITGKKLADFLRTDLSFSKYAVVSVARLPNILAIINRDKQTQSQSIVTLEETRSRRSEPRYHYRFWAAFSVPSDGLARYLNPDDFTFRNLPASEAPPEGWLLVDSEFIAPETADRRDELVIVNISRWLEKNKLDKSRFIRTGRPTASARRSVLDALLASLDKKQLQTTSMSLDVVEALLNKSV